MHISILFRGMKPTAESVGISKLCCSFMTFPSGYCRFRVETQCIPVVIDIANVFFTAFPFAFVSQPSGKQRLCYDNKTNGKAVINTLAMSITTGMHWVSTRKRQEPLGYDIIERQSYEIPKDSAVGFLPLLFISTVWYNICWLVDTEMLYVAIEM